MGGAGKPVTDSTPLWFSLGEQSINSASVWAISVVSGGARSRSELALFVRENRLVGTGLGPAKE